MVDIELISSTDGFKDMEGEWRYFSAATFPENIFLDFDWTWTWWRYFSDTCSLFILRGRRDGVTTGIAPLIITKERFLGMTFRVICFIGGGLCDRANFMLLRHKKETLKSMLNFIMMRSASWDVVDLKEIPLEDENLVMLKECIRSSGIPARMGRSPGYFISPLTIIPQV
jgi:CelD/BcsL family acetyltransferase involved in cellulose biosynthesis